LSHLLTIKSKGKEPLVIYDQSHVVTLDEYMKIIQRHAIEKEIAKKIGKFSAGRGRRRKVRGWLFHKLLLTE
jgi:hypothetical protein